MLFATGFGAGIVACRFAQDIAHARSPRLAKMLFPYEFFNSMAFVGEIAAARISS
jgi:hypothetical protein